MQRLMQFYAPLLIVSAVMFCAPASAGEATPEFGVVFPGNDTELSRAGEYSSNNRDALNRITKILVRWQGNRKVSIVFVSRRFQNCTKKSDCDPEFLLWQRINFIIAKARMLARKSGRNIRFKTLDGLFVDGTSRYRLPPSPANSDVLNLRVVADDNRKPDTNCPWLVRVRDTSFPTQPNAVIPLMPLMANSNQALSSGAQLQILDYGLRRGQFFAFWENAQGKFKKAGQGLARGNLVKLPVRSVTLHLLAVGNPNPSLSDFLDKLGAGFRSLSPLPKFLKSGSAKLNRISRGAGDNVKKVASVKSQLIWPKSSNRQYCKFSLFEEK